MLTKYHLIILLLISSMAFTSCKKYLDQKPDKSITTPSTLDDLAQLLNYYDRMNGSYPAAGEVGSDNYYISDADWAATPSEYHRNLYLWQKFDEVGGDWVSPYRAIMTANVILENIDKLALASSGERQKTKEIKAMAFFIRAYYHFALSQLFMPVYNNETADHDLGIPLKKLADINEEIKRSSSWQTYDFILSDVVKAMPDLPLTPVSKHLPSKAAGYGFLSRIYLSMQEYNMAGICADSALMVYNTLMDYNEINIQSAAPFGQFNEEVIYDSEVNYPNIFNQSRAKVDSNLFLSYAVNDIRKKAFFSAAANGGYFFKGNYTGKPNNPTMFSGIASDELYITRAECRARNGDSTGALNDLNFLLKKRIETATFVPYTLPLEGGLIREILKERRKELLYRTLRWTDLRRLNKDPKYADTLYRFMNGQSYTLLPNSERYTILIDRSTIRLSNIQQNP